MKPGGLQSIGKARLVVLEASLQYRCPQLSIGGFTPQYLF